MQLKKAAFCLSGSLGKELVKQVCQSLCKSGFLLGDRLHGFHLNMENLVGIDQTHLTGTLLYLSQIVCRACRKTA